MLRQPTLLTGQQPELGEDVLEMMNLPSLGSMKQLQERRNRSCQLPNRDVALALPCDSPTPTEAPLQ